jgi:hypothetical protein
MGPAKKLIGAMKGVLEVCPLVDRALFSSFEYTRTGNNLCHPRALGLIAKATWSLADVAVVEIDVRLNRGGGIKFQPDIVARNARNEIILAVDFESPNSSDARVPIKDVSAYLAWVDAGEPCDYLIITSLPDGPTSDWEIRYTARGHYNEGHDGARIRKNPFRYWYGHYKRHLDPRWRKHPIHFANFNGRDLKAVDLNGV